VKIGLGMYPNLLTSDNFRFARQAGATHVVAHLPGYGRLHPGAGAGGDARAARQCLEYGV